MNMRDMLEHQIQQGVIKGSIGRVPDSLHITEDALQQLEARTQFDMEKNEVMLSRSEKLAVNPTT